MTTQQRYTFPMNDGIADMLENLTDAHGTWTVDPDVLAANIYAAGKGYAVRINSDGSASFGIDMDDLFPGDM